MPLFINSDPTRIRQILLNLLGNAFKFTQKGRVSLRVHRVPDADGETVRLRFEVSDTGVGLGAEQQARLFRPFGSGRQFHHAALWRHRPGAEHLPSWWPARRRDRRAQRAGAGGGVLVRIAGAAGLAGFVHDHLVPLTALHGLRILLSMTHRNSST